MSIIFMVWLEGRWRGRTVTVIFDIAVSKSCFSIHICQRRTGKPAFGSKMVVLNDKER